jgi:hypothetical protein
LVIDQTGKIIQLTNVEFLGVNAGKDVGDTLTAANVGNPQVILDDIIYDEAGKLTFVTNAVSGVDSIIWGNHGLVESQRTWDYVKIINDSVFDLVINHIDTSDGSPVVEIQVDDIRFTDPFPNNVSLSPSVPGVTFEFDVKLFYPQTDVEIRNRTAGAMSPATSSCLAVSKTRSGSPRLRISGATSAWTSGISSSSRPALPPAIYDEGLIRTNTLDVDATGDIGNQNAAGGRKPLMVELVRITHAVRLPDIPTLREVSLEADAGGDAVLDITLNDRSQAIAATTLAVTIDHIAARDDVDVVINDSKAGSNLSDIDGITVRTLNPPDLVTPQARTGEYFDHFSPDVTGESLYNFIRRSYGTSGNEVESTYTFLEVLAGDDIDIGHITTTAFYGEPRPYRTTVIGGSPYGASVTEDVPDTTVHFVIHTDVDWSTGSSEDDIEQIFLTTNGNITATEITGDMQVGHIHSTAGDVTLFSPEKILDADGQPTIDVTGDDITMTAGTGLVFGGIGLTNNFLEINVDRNVSNGVLTATDTAAASTAGIYLSDLLNRMRVDLVQTKANVSLRTVEGSILEGRPGGADSDMDAAADVIGISIDIDANGAGFRYRCRVQ